MWVTTPSRIQVSLTRPCFYTNLMLSLTLTFRTVSHTTLRRSFGEAVAYYIECSVRFGDELEMELKEVQIQW